MNIFCNKIHSANPGLTLLIYTCTIGILQGVQPVGNPTFPTFWSNYYFCPTFCFYSYFLTRPLLYVKNMINLFFSYLVQTFELERFKTINFEKMVSKCKIYQHLLHLIHIPTCLVDSHFLNSIPTSVLLFLQIPISPTFLPVLLTGHPDILYISIFTFLLSKNSYYTTSV